MPSKVELRRQVRQQIAAMPDRRGASQQVFERLQSLPEFQSARAVHVYVSLPDEVDTLPLLQHLLAQAATTGAVVVVPYCVAGNQLRLFRLQSEEELTPGAYGILEPVAELREAKSRRYDVNDLDFIIVPGVAFDPSGNRLGRGKGYYDRLLARNQHTCVAALAFDCQMVEQAPAAAHDQPVSIVVTQSNVFRNR